MVPEKPHEFSGLGMFKFSSDLSFKLVETSITVSILGECVRLHQGATELLRCTAERLESASLNDNCIIIRPPEAVNAIMLQFPSKAECSNFLEQMKSLNRSDSSKCVFDQRTEESSATQYFQFYAYLSQQQNMMQDYIRTATYQKAILSNPADFHDKVVLDVGAGSGILSFFAVQGGARRVYAVEASSMSQHCETLVKSNGCSNRIVVIPGKIEEIILPELVDVIISEPMGYMLINERMLESFLHAKKFLKPGGKIYPSRGDLHFAPFTDEQLYLEHCAKANFWAQECFHGVNLTVLREQALKEYFRQPIVDTFHVGVLSAASKKWTIDFVTSSESDLHRIDIPFEFVLEQAGYIHGLALWFDVAFIGSNQTLWLSTAPSEPLTHWYQVRCLIDYPLLGQQGNKCSGRLTLCANSRQSYDVELEMTCNGMTGRNVLDLKNPSFRYSGQPLQPPPGHNTISPSETSCWHPVHQQGVPEEGLSLVSSSPNVYNLANGAMQDGIPDLPVLQSLQNGSNVFGLLPSQLPHCQQPTNSPLPSFGTGTQRGGMAQGALHYHHHHQQQPPQHQMFNPVNLPEYVLNSNMMFGSSPATSVVCSAVTVTSSDGLNNTVKSVKLS